MTAFVHIDYPTTHPAIARAEAVVAAWRTLKTSIGNTFTLPRSLTAFLLGAFLSALILVADRFIDSFADGHLLATWIAMWMYVFTALALLAPTARRMATAILKKAALSSQRAAARRADDLYLRAARNDPRLMAELQAALQRQDEVAMASTEATGLGSTDIGRNTSPIAGLSGVGKGYLNYI